MADHISKPGPVNPVSEASFFLEMLVNDLVIASGTGFVWTEAGHYYLISNWHNFSGRRPDNGDPLHKFGGTPTHVKVYGHGNDLGTTDHATFSLLDEHGSPAWLEHPRHQCKVDVAALPLLVDSGQIGGFDLSSALDLSDNHAPWPTYAGETVFVLGYPFGISDSSRLPIWKAGSIASEPSVDQLGLPLLYVDAATRSGMSGSPVILFERRPMVMKEGDHFSRFRTSFVGIYSGRIAPTDHLEAQLGRVWKAECVREIVLRGVPGAAFPRDMESD